MIKEFKFESQCGRISLYLAFLGCVFADDSGIEDKLASVEQAS